MNEDMETTTVSYGAPSEAPANSQREPVNSIEEKAKKESIQVPTSLVRWFCYAIFFEFLLTPVRLYLPLDARATLAIAAILAHFSGQINKLIDKLDNKNG